MSNDVLIDVARFDDLVEAVPLAVRVRNREIVLVRWQGEVYALRNVCPHQAQSFQGGTVANQLVPTGVVGDVGVDEDQPSLVCPWHKYEFRLRDGRCNVDSTLKIRTYPVVVQNGRVFIGAD